MEASPSLPAFTVLPHRTLASLCLCGPGIPCPLSSLCAPEPLPNPHPLPCSKTLQITYLRGPDRGNPALIHSSASKEMSQFDANVLLTSPSPAYHPLEEGKDKPGLPASPAPLFRPTVFISMVTSELPAIVFLFTLVMEFPSKKWLGGNQNRQI